MVKKAVLRILKGLATAALLRGWICAAALAAPPDMPPPGGVPPQYGSAAADSLPMRPGGSPSDEPPAALDDLLGAPAGRNLSPSNSAQTPHNAAAEVLAPPGPDGMMLGEGQVIPPTLSTRDWLQLHDYYAEFDADVLDYARAMRTGREIIDQADARFFDRTDLALGISAGAKFTFGSYLGEDFQSRDHSVEVTYEGLNSWAFRGQINAAGTSVVDNGGANGNFGSLITTINFPNSAFFNGADFYKVVYQSTLNSLETNVRIQTEVGKDQMVYNPDTGTWVRHIDRGPTFALLFGLRYLNLNERINVAAGLNETTGTIQGFPTADFGGSYNANVSNNLAGLQLGGDLNYQYEKWFFGFDFRAAPCLNFANDASNIFFNDPALAKRHFESSKTTTAFISEIGMSAGYQISPHARLKLVYDFEWLTNVGQAPSQLNLPGPNGPAQVNTSNGVFLNGLTGGVDFIW